MDNKFCEFCGEKIDKDAIVCSKCGRQVQKNKNDKNVIEKREPVEVEKFYTKSWFMWVMLIFFAPVGIFFMWKFHPEMKKNLKIALSVVFSIVFIIYAVTYKPTAYNNSENKTDENSNNNATIYTIDGLELGQFGRTIVLNKNSDMPVTKYLYKLPSGSYTVTTTFEKLATFYIVKDDIAMTGSKEYPEELNYVSDQYGITASNNDFNGLAQKSVKINIKDDESILINQKAIYKFEKN